MIRVCPLSALPRGEALRVEAEPPIAVFHARRGQSHRIEHWTGALERPQTAVASLLSGSAFADTVAKAANVPYFWSDQYDVRIQFAGHAADADSVTVEEGSIEGRDVLAVYRRGDAPVAVLSMNQVRLFGRWRRQLNAASVPV